MNLLTNILISGAISILGAFGVYNFAPLSWFDSAPKTFGTALTTINGSDTLSSSRTTINNNFTALNNGKIEVGSTTINALTSAPNLTTVGTITSGTWNGSVIDVARQGTGTTTPTLNQVMIGNGASGFKVIGFGNSGQFLQSNGNAAAPSWETGGIDTTLDRNWTGTNLFKNLNASSTSANPIVLNGVSYSTQSTQGASSTVLTNNGSGGLVWMPPTGRQYSYSTTTNIVTPVGSYATSTGFFTLPGGVVNASSTISFKFSLAGCYNTSGGGTCYIYLRDSTGATFAGGNVGNADAGELNYSGFGYMDVFFNGAITSQTTVGSAFSVNLGVASSGTTFPFEGTSSINFNNAVTFAVVIKADGNTDLQLNNYSIIVNP